MVLLGWDLQTDLPSSFEGVSPGRERGQAAGGSGESGISFFRPRGRQGKPDPGQAWVIPTDRCDPSGRRPAGQHRRPLHSHLCPRAQGGDEGSSSAGARPGAGRGMTTPTSTHTRPHRSPHEQAAGACGRGQGPATLLTQRRNDSSSSPLTGTPRTCAKNHSLRSRPCPGQAPGGHRACETQTHSAEGWVTAPVSQMGKPPACATRVAGLVRCPRLYPPGPSS